MNTNDLAEYLATEEGLSVVRSLQGLGVLGARPAALREGREAGEDEPRAILEWKPVQRGGDLVFERADFYRCKPKSIAAKHPGAHRVCLFGESMAAGFPLAPSFSPSVALEEILGGGAENRALEVLDFAVPNMGPSEQLRVCEAAMQLAPDVCIFMTGNNWYYGLSVEPTAGPDARATYARRLEEGGANALSAAFRHALEARAQVMVKTMIDAARAAGAHPLVVVPASNHAWERRNAPPWLEEPPLSEEKGLANEAATNEWFERLGKAESALRSKAWERAIDEATRMEALEGALSGTPQRILAKVLRALGKEREARDAAVRAIDASNWHNYSWALPQVPSYVAAAMRSVASDLGATCIDLETVLAAHTGSPYLDFRMFYDQCHLSAEGTRVAMRAVAESVASRLPSASPRSAAGTEPGPRPTAVIGASAAFQAAHWMSQFYAALDARDLLEMLRDALTDVVALDETFVSVLKDQLRMKSLACSPGLNAALPGAARVPGVAASLLSSRLNAPFFSAIVSVLEARGDREVESIVASILAGYDARLRDGLDIAQTTFRAWFWERTPLAWNDPCERQGSPFYRASWPVSHFDFLSGGTHSFDLELVARAGLFLGKGSLLVNDAHVTTFELAQAWTRSKLRVASSSMKRGPNRITVAWPSPASKPAPNDGEPSAIARATKRFAIGADGDLFPVFGEVFSLRLRSVSPS